MLLPVCRIRAVMLRAVALLLACGQVYDASPKVLAQAPTGIYLTWTDSPATTMTINWVNLYAKNTQTIWYRQVTSETWQSAEAIQIPVGPSTLQLRRVELTNLQPDTLYEFGIGKKLDDPKDGWRFRTMPATLQRPITFVAGGDMMHSRDSVDKMNAVVSELEPDFALLGGDLAYANGVDAQRWVDWLQSWLLETTGKDRRLIPMVVAIGNHEVRGGYNGKIPDDAPYFYSFFKLPNDLSYYALDFGSYLSLVILDSNHTQPIEGPQAQWLKNAMADRTRQQFLFACYHYPAYGTTKAPENGTPLDAKQSIAIRQHWVPTLEEFGVTAIFENDHHNYKRTYRIRQHKRDDANGLLYVGDGAWAVKTRTVPKPGEAWWLERAEGRNHVWHVELQATGQATLRAIDIEGVEFDKVVIPTPRTVPVAP